MAVILDKETTEHLARLRVTPRSLKQDDLNDLLAGYKVRCLGCGIAIWPKDSSCRGENDIPLFKKTEDGIVYVNVFTHIFDKMRPRIPLTHWEVQAEG